MPPRLFSINGPLVLPRICIFCSQRLARPRIPAPKFTSLWINPRRARLYSSLIQSPTITTLRLHDAKAKLRHSLTELSTLNLANQSRVQLALRSLEQENAPVRIAVLGISSEEEAVKVVETGVSSSMAFPAKFLKVLLANHYSAEQDWEEKLTNWTGWSEGRGLLIQ